MNVSRKSGSELKSVKDVGALLLYCIYVNGKSIPAVTSQELLGDIMRFQRSVTFLCVFFESGQ